jgi:hypothetical protein
MHEIGAVGAVFTDEPRASAGVVDRFLVTVESVLALA